MNKQALENLKILDLGQVIAGPFASTLLADFGAEVIKIERPEFGENMRYMGPMKNNLSLQFIVENRNKKTITLDLKKAQGKEIFLKLVEKSDVVVENFLPGTMENLGLNWNVLHEVNPGIIFARVSGYGQTGPYKNVYGYDRIAMAMGGLTYVTGFPDRAPLRAGLAVADYLAGMLTALGIMIAVYYRDISGSKKGQIIDMSLYEAVFRCMEGTVPDYSLNKNVRERTGNFHPLSVPGDSYKTKDDKWVVLAIANDRVFVRFINAIGCPEIVQEARFKSNDKRSEPKSREALESITKQWMSEHTLNEIMETLWGKVPVSPILSIEDIFNNQQYIARDDIITVTDDRLGELHMQGVFPKLSLTPGKIKWGGLRLGHNNEEIYKNFLGISETELNDLVKNNVI